jgi:hypothetical protein
MLLYSAVEVRNATSFHKGQILDDEVSIPHFPYVAIACRRNLNWAKSRNLSDAMFIKLADLVKEIFPGYGLLVVSDQIGCEYFKNVAVENSINCLFSKDLSKSFLGDATLALQSEIWIQVKGGGIGVFPLWSNLPFLFYGRISGESSLIRKGRRFRLNSAQTFRFDFGEPSQRRLKVDLKRIEESLRS